MQLPSRRFTGFTLIELMIVVAVIAILTAIALPAYNTYVTRSKFAEAQNGLASYQTQLEQYFQDNRSYGTATCGDNAISPVSIPVLKYFTITCALIGAGATGGYTATATGNAGTAVANFSFTIDQGGNRTTASVASGWSQPAPNTCWITNKGGICS